jgi:hypothetical protein
MTNGASVVALQPLLGVSTDRFFDAARLIRLNLDFIVDETVGYLTSIDYKNPVFNTGISTIKQGVKSLLKAVSHDITRGGNSKCVDSGKSYYTAEGVLQNIVGFKTETIDALNYSAGIARSCINNVSFAKTSGGNYQTYYTQVKDLSIQPDGAYGNQSLDGCANVVSAIYSCVGVVTTIIDQGLGVLGVGFNTTYPGNMGKGFESIVGVTSAIYEETSGKTTIIAPGLPVKVGDLVELRDLIFSCSSGGPVSTQKFPSGYYGYEFYVTKINLNNSFDVYTGISTIPHTYISGGYIINRSIGVTTASYDNLTGITTITAPGISLKVGDLVTLRDLLFSCSSGGST